MLQKVLKFIFFTIFIFNLNTEKSMCSGIDSTYQITIKIKDLKNSEIYLAYHYGQKKMILDTTTINDKGIAIFSGNKKLNGGIYLIAFPSKQFFEIIIDDDQIFSIETDTTNYVNSMKISGSKENEIFNKYQKKMNGFQIQTYKINRRMNENQNNQDSLKILNNELKIVQKNIRDVWATEAKANEGTLLGKLIKAMIEPEFPADSTKAFQYHKDHYWDNIDLSDERLLRSPILSTKLNRFLENAIEQRPDSVVSAVEKLIKLTEKNDKVFKSFIMQIINFYEASNAYAMDEVFIYFAEKYIINKSKFWNNEHFIELTNYKIKIKKSIVTGQVAPNLRLQNANDELISMHDIDAKLTVLYFWAPDCGHCQKSTPIVYDLFEKYKNNGLQVYAVNCETNKDEWITYLDSNKFNGWINVFDPQRISNFQETFDIIGTPVIYLLDENKRIVAKKINVETLERLLVYFYNLKNK